MKALIFVFVWSGLVWPAAAIQNTPEAVKVFRQNVEDYVSLRARIERDLPPIAANPTMVALAARQQALFARLEASRAGSRKGDVFGVGMRTYSRELVGSLLAAPEGPQIRQSIMDVNPVTAVVEINHRYPDAIPLSRMPYELLKALPPLPEGLEYHFVGSRLILLDTQVRMVVDLIDDVLIGK
jgi:hypothetical protein